MSDSDIEKDISEKNKLAPWQDSHGQKNTFETLHNKWNKC